MKKGKMLHINVVPNDMLFLYTWATFRRLWTDIPRSVLISIFFACHVLKRWNVTDPLRGEFTGHRWNPLTKASDADLWCCLWSAPWINGWVSNRETGDLRLHRAHYDVIVMTKPISSIHLFPPVFIIVKNCFESTYCVHIWQILPQLSCGKTCQILAWLEISNIYFCTTSNFNNRRMNKQSLSNPNYTSFWANSILPTEIRRHSNGGSVMTVPPNWCSLGVVSSPLLHDGQLGSLFANSSIGYQGEHSGENSSGFIFT